MVVHISSAVLAAILDHAGAAPDVEVCGLLFGDEALIDAATPAANVHPDPARHFEVDPQALLSAHKSARAGGPRLLGAYHSHPGGQAVPSAEDIALAEPGRLCLIVAGRDAALYRRLETGMPRIALEVVPDRP